MKVICIDYWSERFQRASEVVKNSKMIAEALGISLDAFDSYENIKYFVGYVNKPGLKP